MFAISKSSLKWILIGACLLCLSLQITHAQADDDDAGYAFVQAQGLGQDLNLSQTQDDITATVESFYADENRVIVTYNVIAADDAAPRNVEVELTDATESPYELYPDNNPAHTREALVASFRVGYNYLAEMSPFVFTINVSEDISFEFEIEAEVHFAERVVWDVRYDAATVSMHLYEISVSPSMTVTTFCYTMPSDETWSPQGTIHNVEGTFPLRSFPSFILIEDEPCVDAYAFLPYDFAGTSAPITLTIDQLATPRLRTLENLRNLQAQAAELGVTVEIIDIGDPVGYSYTVDNPTPEFSTLVDELLYEHIAGPWLFQLGGLP